VARPPSAVPLECKSATAILAVLLGLRRPTSSFSLEHLNFEPLNLFPVVTRRLDTANGFRYSNFGFTYPDARCHAHAMFITGIARVVMFVFCIYNCAFVS